MSDHTAPTTGTGASPRDVELRRRQQKRKEIAEAYAQSIDDVEELHVIFCQRHEDRVVAAVLALAAVVAGASEEDQEW